MATPFFRNRSSSSDSPRDLAPSSARFEATDPPQARAHRARLVAELVREGTLREAPIIDAMRRVPRHLLMPNSTYEMAYRDYPVSIGHQQTISQPTIVAIMTEALELTGQERVLEIGTGSGYQSAILSLLARQVFSIERIAELGEKAREALFRLGCDRVNVRIGDGYRGWPEQAPFDRIIITAAPPEIPPAVLDQLDEGGVLVAPVGDAPNRVQRLIRARKTHGELQFEDLGAVRFVPMVEGSVHHDWN